MNPLREVLARHKAGAAVGIHSVCTAHPLALRAAMVHARDHHDVALIEATCNQVNQEGGYTGLKPAEFAAQLQDMAVHVGLPLCRLVLGGDHLGPNPWRKLPAEQAMRNAEVLIADYVAAGFHKIHLDCSMACADDPERLPEELIARRAARLCQVAEAAQQHAGSPALCYVIGSEVPPPGGAREELAELCATRPQSVADMLSAHRTAFAAAGLEAAWEQVIALVVQPGVEFDHEHVVAFDPPKAQALSAYIERQPGLVYEAHSTDYQTPAALAALVRAHFAILKVGPAVTFALREALFALDAIETEWLGAAQSSGLRRTVLAAMRADPQHWQEHYPAADGHLDYLLQFSPSDRIRYYWPAPQVRTALSQLLANLSARPVPLTLISQYLPEQYRAIRAGRLAEAPLEMVLHWVGAVLEDYGSACRGAAP